MAILKIWWLQEARFQLRSYAFRGADYRSPVHSRQNYPSHLALVAWLQWSKAFLWSSKEATTSDSLLFSLNSVWVVGFPSPTKLSFRMSKEGMLVAQDVCSVQDRLCLACPPLSMCQAVFLFYKLGYSMNTTVNATGLVVHASASLGKSLMSWPFLVSSDWSNTNVKCCTIFV